MKKIKVYRVIGWLLIVLGLISILASIATSEKLQRIINDPSKSYGAFLNSFYLEQVPFVYSILLVLATNIFIWIGLILHWRADRNETPDKKSKWGEVIKPYLIFAIIMIILTAGLIILHRIIAPAFELITD